MTITCRRHRREFARSIRAAVFALPELAWETICGHAVLRAKVGDLDVQITTPSSKLIGHPASNGMDIWTPRGKVLSIWWNDRPGGELDDDLEIIACVPGDWDAPLFGRE